MKKIITFSIAAYNIEKYIDKLMNTLLVEEIIDDIEILIVDDGSTDRTAIIGQEYEKKFSGCVRFINKKNAGHGSTINKGMDLATGKYFKPIDGDDWVDEKGLVELINKLKNCNSDMVICNLKYCYETGEVEEEKFKNITPNKEYKFEDICLDIGWMRYHAIIYKTDILKSNNIKLDENIFYVDTEYDIYPLVYIDTIVYFDINLYCYRLGIEGQSVSIESRIKNKSHSFLVSMSLIKFYNEIKKNITANKKKYILDGISEHCRWHYDTLLYLTMSYSSKKEILDYAQRIKELDDEVYLDILKKSKVLSILHRNINKYYYIVYMYKKFKR